MSVDDLKSLVDLLTSLVKAPPYYTYWENQTSNGGAIIFALIGLVAALVLKSRLRAWSVFASLAIAAATFLLYSEIVDRGQIFWWQIACRFVLDGSLGYCLGYALPGGDREKDPTDKADKDGASDSAVE